MQYTRSGKRSHPSGLNTGFSGKMRLLQHRRVVWRSSWQLGKLEIPTPSCSSSPLCLLRPAQTIILKSTKGDYEVQEEEQVEDGNASE
ncbi:hypothetical protein Taro_005163 [Colocasia esculenta]|uniref:Uncharacterized protein n=1 Tax=Colocasia esculenta TaxID=4460 RepID=A0A843TMC2_COLES|nr:hypothetical protein [Colocasia esculenta]